MLICQCLAVFLIQCKAGNTLEHAQLCMATHHTKLPRCTSVDSTNNPRHMLQTCSCTAHTRSDHCWSIKISIILCVLSVDSFFAVYVVLVANRRIICYSELNFVQFCLYRINYAFTHAHTLVVVARLAPHHRLGIRVNISIVHIFM